MIDGAWSVTSRMVPGLKRSRCTRVKAQVEMRLVGVRRLAVMHGEGWK